MILNEPNQRSSFTKEMGVKGGFSAIDMDRLANRLTKNIIGSVQVDPSGPVKRVNSVIDISAEAETLLESIEREDFSGENGSLDFEFLSEMAASFPYAAPLDSSTNTGDTDVKEDPQHPASHNAAGFSVTFDHIIVREYPQILGANSLFSGGPNISIDWEYLEHPPLSVDDFESIRTVRRHRKDLLLSKTRREKIASRILAESELADMVRKSQTSKQPKPVLSIKERLKSILAPQRQ